MRTIIVKIESNNDVEITSKSIEAKFNFCPVQLKEQDKIKVTDISDSMIEKKKVEDIIKWINQNI